MERTESKIVQVAPDAENEMVEMMQVFGWNLLNRQEVIGHLMVEGDDHNSFGGILKSSLRSGDLPGGSLMNLERKVTYDHYSKLQFSRSLSLPHLEQRKALQREFESLRYPAPPKQYLPGGKIVSIVLFYIWIPWMIFVRAPKVKAWEAACARINAQGAAIIEKAKAIDFVVPA